MTKNKKEVKPEQLELGVKVSALSNIRNRYAKFSRSISISPTFVVLKSVLFWINCGVIGSIFFILHSNSDLLKFGKGVVFTSAYESDLFLAKIFSVKSLDLLYYGGWIALLIHISFSAIAAIISARGNLKIIPFILSLDLLLLLFIVKTILNPIILLH